MRPASDGRGARAVGTAGRPVTGSGSVQLGDPAAVGAAHRSLDALCRCCICAASRRRFPGGADGPAGQGRADLSPAVISRLTAEWQGEYERWQKRDLSARRYVYVWADGVFCRPAWKTTAM